MKLEHQCCCYYYYYYYYYYFIQIKKKKKLLCISACWYKIQVIFHTQFSSTGHGHRSQVTGHLRFEATTFQLNRKVFYLNRTVSLFDWRFWYIKEFDSAILAAWCQHQCTGMKLYCCHFLQFKITCFKIWLLIQQENTGRHRNGVAVATSWKSRKLNSRFDTGI